MARINVKYWIGFVLYTIGSFWLSKIDIKLFYSISIITIGILFLINGEKHC